MRLEIKRIFDKKWSQDSAAYAMGRTRIGGGGRYLWPPEAGPECPPTDGVLGRRWGLWGPRLTGWNSKEFYFLFFIFLFLSFLFLMDPTSPVVFGGHATLHTHPRPPTLTCGRMCLCVCPCVCKSVCVYVFVRARRYVSLHACLMLFPIVFLAI